MKQGLRIALLLLTLVAAAALRLTGVDWDDYHHYHPDERYITWVATTIEWPSSTAGALDPLRSSLNPYYWAPGAASPGIEVPSDEPRRFAYGHLPLYLGVAATRLVDRLAPSLATRLPQDWLLTRDVLNAAGLIEFRHLTAVTRVLTALFDVATITLTFLMGRRLYGYAAGLLAAVFLALNVMHIQLAHYFTFDPYLTFFTVAAVYLLVVLVQTAGEDETRPHRRRLSAISLGLAAIAIGLAVGSKFTAVLLALPLVASVALQTKGDRPVRIRRLLAAVALASLAFALLNPFALLDHNCDVITPAGQVGPLEWPSLDWRSCFLENVGRQGGMVRQTLDLAFTRQYSGTLPYLYHLEMQFRWGMGPLLAVAAFAGFAAAAWRAGRWAWNALKERRSLLAAARAARPLAAELVILAWVLPFFLTTGAFQVKFMRYLQPVTPFLMLFAAALVLRLPRPVWRWTAAATIILTTALYALGFVSLYRQPHPWVAASEWIYANVPRGQRIVGEQWDDSLPTNLRVGRLYRQRAEYLGGDLTWLTGTGRLDSLEKLERNLDLLAQADYLTLASNRIYGVAPRLPARYPLSHQYHQLLFSGDLGFDVAYVTGRSPGLAGFHLKPDTFGWPGLRPPPAVAEYLAAVRGLNWGRADESFTVYDQPLTIILRNSGRLTAGEMLALFHLE